MMSFTARLMSFRTAYPSTSMTLISRPGFQSSSTNTPALGGPISSSRLARSRVNHDSPPRTLEEMEEVMKQIPLSDLCELSFQLPVTEGSEEVQVVRTALFNTIFRLIRRVSEDKEWKIRSERRKRRKRSFDEVSTSSTTQLLVESTNPLDADIWDSFADHSNDFCSLGMGSHLSDNWEIDGSLRLVLGPESAQFLRILKRFTGELGEHRDFNYANGTITLCQYMEAFAKCNTSYPFEQCIEFLRE